MERDELEELFGAEWAEWMRMTPQQRWAAQDQMWATYLELGGSLDPEPDPQDPLYEILAECDYYGPSNARIEKQIVAMWRAKNAG